MKNKRKLVVAGILILIMVVGTVAAFAASQYSTPAEVLAGLTGREVQSVVDERVQKGKTFGTMAKDAGVLDEFKTEMLQVKKDKLAECVVAGTLTQEQADAIIAKIVSNQAVCDGSGAGCGLDNARPRIGLGSNHGCGQGQDQNNQGQSQEHKNRGHKQGAHGHGQGVCSHDGTCVNR
jgi:hypothetical protein